MAYNSSSVERACDSSPSLRPNKRLCLASGSASSPILIEDAEKEDSRVATALSRIYKEFRDLDDVAQEK